MSGKLNAKRFVALARGDARNITRDGILLLVTLAPLILAAVIRWGVPPLAEYLRQRTGFDLSQHYPFLIGFLTLVPPMMFGMVTGFILLDERDEEILTYISVTPMSRSGFVWYRMAGPVLVSFAFFLIFLRFTGLVPPDPVRDLPVAMLVALEAPLLTLFLAAFAANKVEGLALVKVTGIMFLAPFAGYFIPSRWQLLAGIFPPYWVTKAFVVGDRVGSGFWWYVLGGLLIHGAYLAWLAGRFQKRVG